MGVVDFFTSSSIVENCANELHYEAKEDDETLIISEMVVRIFNACIFFIQGFITRLHAKEGEFALSKDTTVSLWTEYRTWFGGIQLQEVSGGDFVIVSDDLYDEFETFKKKVYSYVDRAFSIVKAVELIDVWCTSCGGVTLKPLHLLGSVYYLMSSAQLDLLCQWVYAK